jgi:ATP-binding cassette subfamily B multidrug efflux pump
MIFIERLPQGYDTYITDASGLSLGERQLIAVARVLLLSPEVVLLDEATSSIDVRTESLLSSSFDALMKGKLSFVVAHRLSTIVGSSLILVMKDGEIIESGDSSRTNEQSMASTMSSTIRSLRSINLVLYKTRPMRIFHHIQNS